MRLASALILTLMATPVLAVEFDVEKVERKVSVVQPLSDANQNPVNIHDIHMNQGSVERFRSEHGVGYGAEDDIEGNAWFRQPVGPGYGEPGSSYQDGDDPLTH